MIDFRLYRLAFLPALVAVVALMFSLEGAPEALEPAGPPGTFDAQAAGSAARQIATTIPDRRPGSTGDAAAADLVADRFADVATGAVSEQRFEASYDGDDVELRNVLLTLPGEASRTVVIVAARDTADPPGAASSAAATGILLELAHALGERQHASTYVLASTSGSEAGAAGTRQLLEELPERDAVLAVFVISQPGSASPAAPYVVASSSGDRSASVQLERTAEAAVETQAGRSTPDESAYTQLARLAIPSGLGEQAPLIAEGIDAIAISSAGERPLAAADDQLDDLGPESIDAFGRAIQSAIGAVDVAVSEPVHGPSAHIEVGRNLVPGWALAALALALLLPAALAAVDACARAMRARLGIGGALAWVAAPCLPFVGALAVFYGLVAVGLVPNPDFPFDPNLYETGARAAVALALVLLAAAATVAALRFGRDTATAAAPAAAGPAIGAVACTACLVLWLANPYLALLCVGMAHVWLLASGAPGALRRGLGTLACAAACIPALAALVAVAAALDLGGQAPWTLALMVADGQIGLGVTLPLCFVAGALVAAVGMLLRRRTLPSGDQWPAPRRARGPAPPASYDR